MESHPLNLAHQQHRRADAHLINNKYEEAMQCHHNAAELLLDAMKSTTSSIALESITLQHNYHLKQKDLLRSKKEQYVRVQKAMEHLKFLAQDTSYNTQVDDNLLVKDTSKVQVAIYRTINQADLLLNTLMTKNKSAAVIEPALATQVLDDTKVEKGQETVIEEIQILNQNLHSLVDKLVLQVELLKDENMTLTERVHYLEKERVKYLNIPLSQDDVPRKFSNVNLVSNEVTNESGQKMPTAKEPHLGRPATTVDRTGQPHFDLSALK